MTILKILLSLSASLTAYLSNRRLLEAGQAEEIARSLSHAQTVVAKANQARLDAERKFNKSNGLPDNNDPNLRD